MIGCRGATLVGTFGPHQQTFQVLTSPMSLQVNLSSREIATAYKSILDGADGEWMILTYEKGSNDLKVWFPDLALFCQ